MEKRNMKSVSTRKEPCGDYSKITCLNRVLYERMVENYNCDMSFLVNDTLLDNLRKPGIKYCTKNQLLSAYESTFEGSKIGMILDEICLSHQPCVYETYSSRVEESFLDDENSSPQVKIEFSTSIVDRLVTDFAYDFQSLISEVGGALGLTLGLSGFSLIEAMYKGMQRLFQFLKRKTMLNNSIDDNITHVMTQKKVKF